MDVISRQLDTQGSVTDVRHMMDDDVKASRRAASRIRDQAVKNDDVKN